MRDPKFDGNPQSAPDTKMVDPLLVGSPGQTNRNQPFERTTICVGPRHWLGSCYPAATQLPVARLGKKDGLNTRLYTHSINASCVHMAVGQNQWFHFGVGAPPILVYVSGDWDVHWGTAFDPWPHSLDCHKVPATPLWMCSEGSQLVFNRHRLTCLEGTMEDWHQLPEANATIMIGGCVLNGAPWLLHFAGKNTHPSTTRSPIVCSQKPTNRLP